MENNVSLDMFDKLISYLSTDRVDVTLNTVLTDTNTPLGFTRHTVKHKSDFIYQEYAKDITKKFNRIPKILRDAWVYEYVFRSAISHRLNYLFANDQSLIHQFERNAVRSLLLIHDPHVPSSIYVGFVNLKDESQQFFGDYPVPANINRLGLTRRFVSTIGNMHDDDWIFHNKLWFDTLNSDRGLLRTLRGFVQIACANIFYTNEIIERMLEIPVTELLDHMEMFIELRESIDTTRSDIVKFIEYVEPYALEASPPSFYHMLCGAPFVDLQRSIHIEQPSEVVVNVEYPFQAHDIIRYLTTICDGHSISKISDSDFCPKDIVDEIFVAHYNDLATNFIPLLYSDDWLVPAYKIPNNIPPKNKRLFNQVIYDHLTLALVGFKASITTNPDMNYVMNYLVNTSHMLLSIEDESQSMGLSLISTLLPYYLRIKYTNFSERELETLMLVTWAWESSNYDRPNLLSKTWKKHFHNPLITRGIRRTFFSLFEVFNFNLPIDFETVFGMERSDFFLYLENLCEYITSNPMTKEVEELFSNSPYPRKYVFLNEEDRLIWIGSNEDHDDKSRK